MSAETYYRTVYIYGLYADDEVDNIRYVGKSFHPKRRTRQHICDYKKKNTPKNAWIKKCLKNNRKINFKILEETLEKDWGVIEQKWIDKLKNKCKLTNLTSGGKGGNKKKYELSYKEVEQWVQKNFPEVKSQNQWFKKIKEKDFPDFIPKTPNEVYCNNGWCGFGKFLGSGNIPPSKLAESYISYDEAKKYISKHLNYIKNGSQWKLEAKKGNIPNVISNRPDRFYKNQTGEFSWYDFLGDSYENQSKKKEKLSYEDAKLWLKNNKNIKSYKDWDKFKKSKDFPDFLPKKPRTYYKEYTSSFDFFSTNKDDFKTNSKNYLSYEEAKLWIKNNTNLKSNKKYRKFVKSDAFPNFLPKSPERYYDNWVSWTDYFSKKKKKEYNFLSFETSKEKVKKFNIHTHDEWCLFVKTDRFPRGEIPTNPQKVYKEQWIDWYDWLGKKAPLKK